MEYDGAVHRDARSHVLDLGRDRRLLRGGWERFGYTSGALLGNGASILRDADQALGRVHRPERIRTWHRLVAESGYSPAGRARLAGRWQRPRSTP